MQEQLDFGCILDIRTSRRDRNDTYFIYWRSEPHVRVMVRFMDKVSVHDRVKFMVRFMGKIMVKVRVMVTVIVIVRVMVRVMVMVMVMEGVVDLL